MSSWFGRWFGYGLGAAAGRAIFDAGEGQSRCEPREPVRQQTEAEIQAAERRYDREAKQLEAEDEARNRDKKRASRGRHPG